MTIDTFPNCIYKDFKDMFVQTKKRGAWFYCKHLYYIFLEVCKLDLEEDYFIHAPTFSFNEVKIVMDAGVARYIF